MLTGRNIIIALSVKFNGDWAQIYSAIQNKYVLEESEANHLLASIPSDITPIVIIDADYPETLKKIYKPPFVIYTRGNTSLLHSQDSVSVLGDLLWDEHLPLFNSSKLSFVLSSSNNDTVLKSCSNDSTVYVAPYLVGFDKDYPLVVSEHLHEVKDAEADFVKKFALRIHVGLSYRALFTGVAKRSTTPFMIALGYALHANLPVGVLKTTKPTSTNSMLINNGLSPLTNLSDIFTIESNDDGVDISRLS
jgi:predicted Rossmann fold nucleotide-binding protein DprA/Smf involved in DNA uptake